MEEARNDLENGDGIRETLWKELWSGGVDKRWDPALDAGYPKSPLAQVDT